MRVLLHQYTAIHASFVSCSELSLILLRNTVCVGHGFREGRADGTMPIVHY
jgi:hypothetical protein